MLELLAQAKSAKAGGKAAGASGGKAATACYERPDQHVSQCHGAMAALGLTVGKNGQLVIANKNRFTTSNEPSKV